MSDTFHTFKSTFTVKKAVYIYTLFSMGVDAAACPVQKQAHLFFTIHFLTLNEETIFFLPDRHKADDGLIKRRKSSEMLMCGDFLCQPGGVGPV